MSKFNFKKADLLVKMSIVILSLGYILVFGSRLYFQHIPVVEENYKLIQNFSFCISAMYLTSLVLGGIGLGLKKKQGAFSRMDISLVILIVIPMILLFF